MCIIMPMYSIVQFIEICGNSPCLQKKWNNKIEIFHLVNDKTGQELFTHTPNTRINPDNNI